MTISWLETLKTLDTETAQEAAMTTDASALATEFSENLTQQGAKSAKRGDGGLLSLLAPPHIRNSESHAPRQECREKDISTQGRPWLAALRGLEKRISKEEEKRAARVFSPTGDEIPESLVQRGA